MTIPSTRPGATPTSGKRRVATQVADTTPVLTPTGWLSAADVRGGDAVLGPRGDGLVIIGTGESTGSPQYLATISDGSSVVVGPDHNVRRIFLTMSLLTTVSGVGETPAGDR